VESNAAAVGMADKMDLVRGPVDEVDGPGRLVGEGEYMLVDPGARSLAAIVLRSE
jgi:hypothetical protein